MSDISLKIPRPWNTKNILKLSYLKCHSNLPGANELTGALVSLYITHFYVSPCNSLEDYVSVDFIYGYLIFEWVVATGQGTSQGCDHNMTCPIELIQHQAPSHYQSQYWPRSMSPYGITRSQWVKSLEKPIHNNHLFKCFNICRWSKLYHNANSGILQKRQSF